MPALSPATLLLFALLSAPAVAQSPLEGWEALGVRRIELGADVPGQGVEEVRISPGRSTTFFFDAALLSAWVELEGRERFQMVSVAENGRALILLPSGELQPGTRLRLRLRFADGAVPASAEFLLVVHPSRAEQQVEVHRRPRSAESYRQEAREARAASLRCEAELARVREARGLPDGLIGMLKSGLMDEAGVPAQKLHSSKHFTQPPEAILWVKRATGFLARGRAALELKVRNRGTEPWMAAGAEWVGEDGARLKVLGVWMPEPLLPGEDLQRVVVEVEWGETAPRGPYTLRIWDESGARMFTLEGLVLP